MTSGQLGPITRAQIMRFAEAVNDFNAIHVDDETARRLGLPSVVAHGPLTATLLLDAIIGAGYAPGIAGLDARLQAPVLPGDELSWELDGANVEVRNGADVIVAALNLEPEER